jgi:RNA-binding protein
MLTSKQRSYLGSIAIEKAVAMNLGRAGASEALAAQLDGLLERHELVKLRFGDHKDERTQLAEDMASKTHAELVRVIGNTALFYRRNPDPERRSIELPTA